MLREESFLRKHLLVLDNVKNYRDLITYFFDRIDKDEFMLPDVPTNKIYLITRWISKGYLIPTQIINGKGYYTVTKEGKHFFEVRKYNVDSENKYGKRIFNDY